MVGAVSRSPKCTFVSFVFTHEWPRKFLMTWYDLEWAWYDLESNFWKIIKMRNSHLWSEWHIYYPPCDFPSSNTSYMPLKTTVWCRFHGKMVIILLDLSAGPVRGSLTEPWTCSMVSSHGILKSMTGVLTNPFWVNLFVDLFNNL